MLLTGLVGVPTELDKRRELIFSIIPVELHCSIKVENDTCYLSDHFCSDSISFRCHNTTLIYGNLELDFCVYGSLVCDGKADCEKGEDEENCIRMSNT